MHTYTDICTNIQTWVYLRYIYREKLVYIKTFEILKICISEILLLFLHIGLLWSSSSSPNLIYIITFIFQFLYSFKYLKSLTLKLKHSFFFPLKLFLITFLFSIDCGATFSYSNYWILYIHTYTHVTQITFAPDRYMDPFFNSYTGVRM